MCTLSWTYNRVFLCPSFPLSFTYNVFSPLPVVHQSTYLHIVCIYFSVFLWLAPYTCMCLSVCMDMYSQSKTLLLSRVQRVLSLTCKSLLMHREHQQWWQVTTLPFPPWSYQRACTSMCVYIYTFLRPKAWHNVMPLLFSILQNLHMHVCVIVFCVCVCTSAMYNFMKLLALRIFLYLHDRMDCPGHPYL